MKTKKLISIFVFVLISLICINVVFAQAQVEAVGSTCGASAALSVTASVVGEQQKSQAIPEGKEIAMPGQPSAESLPPGAPGGPTALAQTMPSEPVVTLAKSYIQELGQTGFVLEGTTYLVNAQGQLISNGAIVDEATQIKVYNAAASPAAAEQEFNNYVDKLQKNEESITLDDYDNAQTLFNKLTDDQKTLLQQRQNNLMKQAFANDLLQRQNQVISEFFTTQKQFDYGGKKYTLDKQGNILADGKVVTSDERSTITNFIIAGRQYKYVDSTLTTNTAGKLVVPIGAKIISTPEYTSTGGYYAVFDANNNLNLCLDQECKNKVSGFNPFAAVTYDSATQAYIDANKNRIQIDDNGILYTSAHEAGQAYTQTYYTAAVVAVGGKTANGLISSAKQIGADGAINSYVITSKTKATITITTLDTTDGSWTSSTIPTEKGTTPIYSYSNYQTKEEFMISEGKLYSVGEKGVLTEVTDCSSCSEGAKQFIENQKLKVPQQSKLEKAGTAIQEIESGAYNLRIFNTWLDKWDGLQEWKSKVDNAFAKYYLGVDPITSRICDTWDHQTDAPVNYALGINGLPAAHIEGERSATKGEDKNGNLVTAYVYKVSFAFDPANILVQSDDFLTANLFVRDTAGVEHPVRIVEGVDGSDSLVVKGTSPEIRYSGNNIIVRIREGDYTQVCIRFGPRDRISDLFKEYLDNEQDLCNSFVKTELPDGYTDKYIMTEWGGGGGGKDGGGEGSAAKEKEEVIPTTDNNQNTNSDEDGL